MAGLTSLVNNTTNTKALTTDSTKTANKLAALLRLIRDDLQRSTKVLVVVGQPFKQRLILHQLHLDAALHTNKYYS